MLSLPTLDEDNAAQEQVGYMLHPEQVGYKLLPEQVGYMLLTEQVVHMHVTQFNFLLLQPGFLWSSNLSSRYKKTSL